MEDRNTPVASRRSLLSGLGIAGLSAIAGCTSSGSSDQTKGDSTGSDGNPGQSNADENLIFSTASSATALYAAAQGMGAIVNQNNDDVYLDVRPSNGQAANMGTLNRGEADLAALSEFVAQPVVAREPPFEDIDFELTQVGHIHTSDWFLMSNNKDWQTWTDISSNTRICPGASGTTVREMITHALQEVGNVEYQATSIGYGDQGGALSSGRIEAGVGCFVNTETDAIEPSWVQQIKSTADVKVLEIPEDTLSELQDSSRITITTADVSEFDGFVSLPNPANLISLVSYIVSPARTSEEKVYSMLKTMWDNREELGDYHGLLNYHKDADWWVDRAFTDVPFHPGAERFYKEIGVWQDSFSTV